MTSDSVTRGSKHNVLSASGWMIGLSVALVWLPLIGPLIAGFVGGRKAGAIAPALIAVFMPGLILGIVSFFLGGFLSAIPLIGAIFAAVFGTAGYLLSFMQIGPLVVGALLGGWTANK